VLEPPRDAPDPAGLRRVNARLARAARVDVVMLPIADGVTMIRRRA
jgi:O-methyltransferase